jgi:hypothetical protein
MALITKPLEAVRKDVPIKEVADTGEKVRVNFEVDKATRTRWKTEALSRDVPLADLLRSAMDEYLSK